MVDFINLSKSDWKDIVFKELKTTPFDSLIWKINDRISIDPYYTKAELKVNINPIPHTNDWYIGETFNLGNPETCNDQLLTALDGGVGSPLFIVPENINIRDIKNSLKKAEFSYLFNFIQFQEGVSDKYIIEKLELISEFGNTELDDMFGCLILPKENKIRLFEELSELSSGMYVLGFETKSSIESVDIKLAELLSEVRECFDEIDALDPAYCFLSSFFTFEIGNNYLFEIARLRAFSILWGNLQLAYGIESLQVPFLNIVFDPKVYGSDVNTNMIKATTMTMSAAIGGASRITVLPSDQTGSNFSRRIARNVQHLLLMESYFDKVIDPAAGSYYIETLTQKIAESAWKIFLKGEEVRR